MPSDYFRDMCFSLQALQASMPPKVMRELSVQSRMLQQFDPRQLSISLEQAQYLAKHDAEIARMHRTYSQLCKIMRPLVDKYPQLQEIDHAFQEQQISSQAEDAKDDLASDDTQEDLYTSVQEIVNEALECGVIQDATPDKRAIHNMIFSVSYYAFSLTPQQLYEWLSQSSKKLSEYISEHIDLAGKKRISGLLNIYSLFKHSLSISSFLRDIL